MHILLIHQYFLEKNDSGGSRWNEMVNVWSQAGHRVTVIAGMTHYSTGKKHTHYKGRYMYEEQHTNANVKIFRCHVSERYNASFSGRLIGYISFLFSSIFTGIYKAREKYDFIIVSSPPLFVGISGYFLSRWKRIPYVFEIRDLWPESAVDTGIVKNKLIIKIAYATERFIYRKSSLINVLTPAFEEALIRKKNIDPGKIICIPNAADFSLSENLLQTFDAANFRKEMGWEDKFVICYVGAHGVANKLTQLLQAADMLRNDNVLFVLIGDGMEKKMLKQKAESLQLANIQFIDPVPKSEIFKFILASDIGTSVLMRNDIFKTVYSNKTFDYLSCKKPVLMAIDGVSRDLMEKADGGIFAEPENAEDIAEKIRFYIKNPDVLKRQGENGYTYVKEHFDRTKLAAKYLQLLQKHIKGVSSD